MGDAQASLRQYEQSPQDVAMADADEDVTPSANTPAASGSDVPHPAVKKEGLLDKSDDPVKSLGA